VNSVHYRKRKLSLRKVLGETFIRRILVLDETRQIDANMVANLVILKIHIVIPNLKVDPNQVDQRDVVTEMDLGLRLQIEREPANTSVLRLAQAIISLTATRNNPPVSVKGCKELKTESQCLRYLTIIDHRDIFVLGGASQRVSPQQVKTLSTMKIQQFSCRCKVSSVPRQET